MFLHVPVSVSPYLPKAYTFAMKGLGSKETGVLHWCGGTVASRLVRSTPDRVVRVRVLAGDINLCCVLGQDTLLSLCLSPPKSNAGGNPAMDWHPIQGGVEILMLQKPEISAGLTGLLGL